MFTPGEWSVSPSGKVVFVQQSEFTKAYVATCAPHNANLISAAPNLLKIAELILLEWEKPTEGVLPGELIARLSQYSIEARAAIKKAKGES